MGRDPNAPQAYGSTGQAPVQDDQAKRTADAKKVADDKKAADKKAADAKKNEIQFFDTTISKVVTDDDGNEVDVMSDNLYPGERLKREVDEEKAEEKLASKAKAAKDTKNNR